ncbi:TRAP-type C4-dicarboxylate transport system, small permease component [Tistlia consotensis]|uniref:TRAP transporter small permease protein n=1 Tax=Tistlia consotensis USBA 355 TaxID=560819 RepID=A0A1Y6CHN2_9PROT|nr:TRAP transporter small permease [Tistlia consotensis]SMF64751.1 TRAP-type C4-dicarboxylate transport system, small permease component [Tistlia consotensis USBA 355]SNR96736.1 TRAP-type C4-dicarboxylate transport system, small permease component [Tistlia consotensis]
MTDTPSSASPVLRLLDRLEPLYRACGLVAAGFLIALTGLVLASILSRLAGVFLGGVTELAGYAMAAGSFFALAWTFKTGGHIRVALLINRFGDRGRVNAERWCRAVMAAGACYLAFYMGRLAWFSWLFGERSEGSAAFLLWVPQSLVTIGAAALALATLDSFLRVLIEPERALASPEADTKGSGGEP